MHIKLNDTVLILSGKDRGKTGKVLKSFPKDNKVLVEGINVRKIHIKAKKSGGKGEVVEKSLPIHASNVKLSSQAPKAEKKAPVKKAPKAKK